MNTEAMAKAYLDDAAYSLQEAREALAAKRYHRAVRRSQESVEPGLKAVLRLLAVEYPREHDVSNVLIKIADLKELPEWFKGELEAVNEISKKLSEERGPAFYGDEGAFIPPSQLYGEEDAARAVSGAEKVYELCARLFKWWRGESEEH